MGWMGRGLSVAAVVALAAGVSACSGNSEPVPVTKPIAPATIVENYTGTLFVQGSNLHIFAVTKDGEVHVTLKSVVTVPVEADPNANPPVAAIPAAPVAVPMTITVGQPTLTTLGVQCSNLKQVVKPAGPTEQLNGQALAGSFCVSVSDPNGELPRASTYEITVNHS
jgi:hypothetical protein